MLSNQFWQGFMLGALATLGAFLSRVSPVALSLHVSHRPANANEESLFKAMACGCFVLASIFFH
jgi:hypothetical protein